MSHETPETYAWPAAATHEEMKAAMLPLAYRDRCAGLLIPLNKCRKESLYLPWKCNDERHAYEKCEYMEFQSRVNALQRQRAEAASAAAATDAAVIASD
ncbi:NADH-ubiquinone oxidoreductase B18 subunit-domain-containing protein [Kockiozyma suomiensis]|uniref:NADH-ubiquinone oxidoreductase B18 subunit-domain-containing protein n=1 Tax=Kockiozyma suomiensis TaxID=1337062 RepID=UPI003343F239